VQQQVVGGEEMNGKVFFGVVGLVLPIYVFSANIPAWAVLTWLSIPTTILFAVIVGYGIAEEVREIRLEACEK